MPIWCLMMTTRETTPAKHHRNRRVNRELRGLLGEPLSARERDTVAALLAGADNMTDLVLMAVGRKSSVVDLGVGDGTG